MFRPKKQKNLSNVTGAGAVASEQRDWSELPDELLDPIMGRLTKLADVICFQAVCKPWRQAVLVYDEQLKSHRPPKFRQSLPWLTMCYHEHDRTRPTCQHFLDVASKDKIRHVYLPGRGVVFRALMSSSHLGSWQLARETDDRYVLLEPFTGNRIPLPPIPGNDQKSDTSPPFVKCFAMSADPTTKECIVMIKLCDHRYDCRSLPICKLGGVEQQGWTSIPLAPDQRLIYSIVFWRGRFHALEFLNARVLVCDLNVDPINEERSMVSWAFLPKNSDTITEGLFCYNLVVSPEGELMLVTRHSRYRDNLSDWRTFTFSVYKINEDEQRWDEVKNIGDYALFSDQYQAIFVSTIDHPECRKNCVYYKSDAYDIDSKEKLERSFSNDALDDVYVVDHDIWIFPSN